MTVTPGALIPLSLASATNGAGRAVLVGADWLLPLETVSVRTKVAVAVKVAIAVPSSARVPVMVTVPALGPKVTLTLASPFTSVTELGVDSVALPEVTAQLTVTPGALIPLSLASATNGAGRAVLVGADWLLPLETVSVRTSVAVAVKVAIAVALSARVPVMVTGPAVGPSVTLTLASPLMLVTELGAESVAEPEVTAQLMVTPLALTPLSCASTTSGADSAVLVGALWPLPLDAASVRTTGSVTLTVKLAESGPLQKVQPLLALMT